MRIRIDGLWVGQHYANAALALAIGAPADQMIGTCGAGLDVIEKENEPK